MSRANSGALQIPHSRSADLEALPVAGDADSDRREAPRDSARLRDVEAKGSGLGADSDK